jgi:hypothetical protein
VSGWQLDDSHFPCPKFKNLNGREADIVGALQNKEVLSLIFSELAKGNSRPFVERMADEFSWTITGTTKWSKTYQGKSAVLADLFGPCDPSSRPRSPLWRTAS